jgi:hypothetical protein
MISWKRSLDHVSQPAVPAPCFGSDMPAPGAGCGSGFAAGAPAGGVVWPAAGPLA